MNQGEPTTVEEALAAIDAEDPLPFSAPENEETSEQLSDEEIQRRINAQLAEEFANRPPQAPKRVRSAGETFVTSAHLINTLKADKGIRLSEGSLVKLWELSLFATLNHAGFPSDIFGHTNPAASEEGGENEEETLLPIPNETLGEDAPTTAESEND